MPFYGPAKDDDSKLVEVGSQVRLSSFESCLFLVLMCLRKPYIFSSLLVFPSLFHLRFCIELKFLVSSMIFHLFIFFVEIL